MAVAIIIFISSWYCKLIQGYEREKESLNVLL